MVLKIERPAVIKSVGPLIVAEETIGPGEDQVFHYVAYQLGKDDYYFLWARSIGSAYVLDDAKVRAAECLALMEFHHWVKLHSESPATLRAAIYREASKSLGLISRKPVSH